MANLSLDTIGQLYVPDQKLGRGKEYKGGDKTCLGKGFTKKYEELFEDYRDDKVEFLELGVLYGRSIAMWSEYFPNGQIHGIDISLGPFNREKRELEKAGAFKNNNVKLYEMDLKSEEFKEFCKTCPEFDFVIDDALHQAKQQFINFQLLFPRMKKGGIYIIEDLVKPMGFVNQFSDILACVGNPDPNLHL